jgi:hypothetical protein
LRRSLEKHHVCGKPGAYRKESGRAAPVLKAAHALTVFRATCKP